MLLEIKQLQKCYRDQDGQRVTILNIDSFSMQNSEHVALRGESGSGKTTLLNAIAGMSTIDSGDIVLDGQNIHNLSEAKRDRFRATHLGYIFQTFNLLQGFTALENVCIGMFFAGNVDKARGEHLLESVGLLDRMHHKPSELSTGQQQRVAVARALANKPKLVIADEPTGNLDRKNAIGTLELIQDACRDADAGLLFVSHSEELTSTFENVVSLSDINVIADGSVR
jgi:ABC-type lipoprotein export system ATPase subunit